MAENTETKKVDTFLESVLDSADEAERLVLGVANEIGFPEDELHKIGMAVRESIVNAVVHGNRYNRRKRVHLAVLNGKDHLTVVIADEGEGFESAVCRILWPNTTCCSSRGAGFFSSARSSMSSRSGG